MKTPYKILKMALAVVILSVNNSAISVATLEEKKQIALQVFPAPGADAKWEIFEQPFWKHSVIFHLTSTSDPRWIHRPFVAVDEKDKAYLLSDDTVKVGADLIIGNFNTLVMQETEGVQITKNNIEDYARFFARVYGRPGCDAQDRMGLLKSRLKQFTEEHDRKEIEKSIDQELKCQKEGLHLTITPTAKGHFSVRYSWLDGEYPVDFDVLIRCDGTIILKEEKWQPLPEQK